MENYMFRRFSNFFKVDNIKGKDEHEVYKNYIDKLPQEKIICFLQQYGQLKKQKNDLKSFTLRTLGNELYSKYNNQQSLKCYNKSLRYATYNGEAYAVALANRSAVFFAMEDYQSCIKDINICLQAGYPDDLKPKVFIRKANCFKKLGKPQEMRTTLVNLLMFIDETPTLLDAVKENYRKRVGDMITMEVCTGNDPQNNFNELPSIDPNPTFLNASASVVLQYNKRSGFHVKAKNDISQGEVIFVEKAYAFAPSYGNGKIKVKTYCQYCAFKTTSWIPCKYCVKHIYCSEKCRNSAWVEFHQWECLGVQLGLVPLFYIANLALRIVLKASHVGISTEAIDFKNGTINSYGNESDNYPYVYNLPNAFGKLPKEAVMNYAATAALIIHYLKLKTNFLDYLKTKPAYANKKDEELMNELGGIMLRHILHLWNFVSVQNVDIHFNKMTEVFLTVCPSMALMAHSCDPNTSYYFIGDTVVVKAMKNIKSNEKLFRSYWNITYRQKDKNSRQRLFKKLFINCQCKACADPKMDRDSWNSYVCPKCNGSAICTELELGPIVIFARRMCVCLDCSYKFVLPENMIKSEALSMELLVKFRLQGDIIDGIRCLQISKTIFQITHSIFQNIYGALREHYYNKGDLKNFIEIGAEGNNRFKVMYTEVTMEYGMFQYRYCIVLMKLIERSAIKVGLSHLRDALNALTISVNEGKTAVSLHYPQLLVYFQKVEEKISKIRILHALKIADMASLNV